MKEVEVIEVISDLLATQPAIKLGRHMQPAWPNSSHIFEIESGSLVGTLSIWPAGSCDWTIFDADTVREAMLGTAVFGTKDSLRVEIEKLFDAIVNYSKK